MASNEFWMEKNQVNMKALGYSKGQKWAGITFIGPGFESVQDCLPLPLSISFREIRSEKNLLAVDKIIHTWKKNKHHFLL